MNPNKPPIILSLSPLDPSGCEGIQADIETAVSLGCHCTTIVTSLFSNGDSESCDVTAIDSLLIIEQARSLLENMDIRAIKLGFPGSVANIEAIHSILGDFSHIPVIVQPSLNLTNACTASQQNELADAFASLLLPLAEIAIVTDEDSQALAKGCDTLDAAAQSLTSGGCQYLLATSPTQHLAKAVLYSSSGLIATYPRKDNKLIDSNENSTLAGAITAMRAHECPPTTAINQAQHFTEQAVTMARELGFNRATPFRLFWADKNKGASEATGKPRKTH